jgi:hypothetical protein
MKTTFTNTQKDKDFMKSIMDVISPKGKTQQINEKLEPHEEEDVEYGWNTDRPNKTEDAITKVFGDKQRIEVPLHVKDEVPHPDVEEHLNKHGFAITDYSAGKAKDKFNREVNIGKVLSKTNADEQIKNAFANDPTRQQKQRSNLKIVISHKPADVAGMTSGHQSWVNQSCMNFKSGAYRSKLEDDVREGTHVAYLTDSDDKDLDRPVARIAVKPYHADDGHTIFRPEQKVYGNANSSFQKNVNDWFEEKYESQPNVTYRKNRHVYDDTGETTHHAMTKESADQHIDNNWTIDTTVPQHIVDHISKRIIEKQINNPNERVMDDFANDRHNIAFNRNQVNAMYKVAKEHGQSAMTWHLASKAGDVLNKSNLQHAIENHASSASLLKHKYLPDGFIDSLPAERLSLIHESRIKPHHVSKVVESYVNGESGSWHSLRSFNDRLNSDHLHALVDKKHRVDMNGKEIFEPSLAGLVAGHKNADKSVIDHLFRKVKDSPDALKIFNKNNQNPTPEHVAKTNTTDGLSDIMEHAKDKLTHNLALHKAIGLSKEGASHQNMIHIRENSNKFLSDSDIKDLYDAKVNTRSMPNEVHERLLNHSMNTINETHAKLHPKDMFDEDPSDYEHSTEWKNAYEENQKHFDKHADLINDKIDDMRSDIRDDKEIDGNYFYKLGSHIDKAIKHPGHDGSHDDVSSDHSDLEYELDERHKRY